MNPECDIYYRMNTYIRNEEEESEFSKRDANGEGVRFDKGKTRYDLLPMRSIFEIARNYRKLITYDESTKYDDFYSAITHARLFWYGQEKMCDNIPVIITAARYFLDVMSDKSELGKNKEVKMSTFKMADFRFDLIPVLPLAEIAKVFTYGTMKYDDNNWRKGMKWGRIYGALERHAEKWIQGEQLDIESGLHHLAHAAWQCIVLYEYSFSKRELDDRISEYATNQAYAIETELFEVDASNKP